MQFVRVSALSFCLIGLGGALTTSSAFAAEPLRVHVAGGATRALGGEQSSQFGTGGSGGATVELAPTPRFGVQAGVGAVVLSKGEPSKDPAIASTGTGTAFLGTVGVRARLFGERAGGPWIDSNMGVARTGESMRPTLDAHIGWDVRVANAARLDVGPYVGYTQIFQPDTEIRGTDARLITAGLSISIGAKEAPKPPPPPPAEAPPRVEWQLVDNDKDPVELADASDVCPDDGEPAPAGESCVGEIRIHENRILLDDIIHFEFGSAKVRAVSFRVVKKLAKFIVEHDEIVDVSIEGHTDEVGTDEYNKHLSVDRATAMRELLINFGAPAKQLHIIGHGKSRLKIVTTKAEEKNRRVELFVTVTKANEAHAPESRANAISHGKSSR